MTRTHCIRCKEPLDRRSQTAGAELCWACSTGPEASTPVTMADVLNELRETELNLTQTLIACTIGLNTKQRQLDFLHGQIERIRDRNRALLARTER